MDVDSSQGQMAAYLRDHQEKVVGRWSELMVAGVRGRLSAVEIRRELEDLYTLVLRAMTGSRISSPSPAWSTTSACSPSRPTRPRASRSSLTRPRP